MGGETRPAGRLTAVRAVGLVLLSIPALLVVLGAGAYLCGTECPAAGALPCKTADYLSMWPVSRHRAPGAQPPARPHAQALASNGTHLFRPTLILVSLDGFRADYLDRGATPNLARLGQEGLRADYMLPSFPSSTFPNHYSIATGLYPGCHGIVSNTFHDRATNATFVYSNATVSDQPQWWEAAEPIWVTAEKQGVRAAIDMWPGSSAAIHKIRPTYVVPFSDNVPPANKTRQLLDWLDLPLDRRPALLAAYMPEVDHAGHSSGPDSAETTSAARLVDAALGELRQGIAQRNLSHIVNLMVVSDHGMAAVALHQNAIYVDDFIDVSRLVGIYGSPLGGIQPKDDRDVPDMYRKLKAASVGQPWRVYLRDEIPARFHYAHKTRVAPIFVVPDEPYYVTTHATDRWEPSSGSRTIGMHGYDNMNPDMRATFVAYGPAFRPRTEPSPPANSTLPDASLRIEWAAAQLPDAGARVSDMSAEQEYLELVHSALVERPLAAAASYRAVYDRLWGDAHLGEAVLRNARHPPFENVQLYGLMSRILGIAPAPNNGTADFARWWLR
ncbi:hypothetical protein H4R18_001392 [Coemansia javaensis]|uniref:Uncharacterized protein n=1 Tax=Coemansia javaensis TaxID=2761396 RepID=A0A9W8LLG2_9FUNG|nr:hypothetical protein H4R18_001392 [Coemansia javaensis]